MHCLFCILIIIVTVIIPFFVVLLNCLYLIPRVLLVEKEVCVYMYVRFKTTRSPKETCADALCGVK